MSDVGKIQEIAAELERRGMSSGTGRVATIVASILVSMIPGVGWIASYLVDKLGTTLSKPDQIAISLELSRAILAIAPEVEKIADIESQIGAITKLLQEHGELLAKAEPLVAASAATLHVHELHNNGGLREVINTTFRNLRLVSITRGGGTSVLDGIDHEGSSRFDVEPGSKQTTQNSVFVGGTSSVRTTSTYGAPATNHGARVEHGAVEQNQVSGTQVTTISDDSEARAGISVSPNGIEFGKRIRP